MAKGPMDMALPLTPEAVTADWLTEALSFQRPGVRVARADIRDVIHGTSTKIRVALAYADKAGHDDLPPTLIVKGGFEAHSPSMAGMYETEVRFYRDVRPHIEMNTPACFYAGSDQGSHQSIVILEDLKAKNVVFCHPQRPVTYEQLARRLDAMARYHAQTWNSPEFEPGGKFEWICTRYEGFGKIYNARYLEADTWNRFMQMPRGAAVPRILHDREWMAGALEKLEEYHKQWPICIVHGDTHLGNLYIEQDGTPGFFDAQTNRGPWQLEVNYHLIVALDVLDRRAWEKSLLTYYLERLKAYGVNAPSFEEAWEAYRRETAYGYFVFAINENQFQTEAVNTAEAVRFAFAAIDHDTVRLLA